MKKIGFTSSNYSEYKYIKSNKGNYEPTRKIFNDNYKKMNKQSYEVLKEFANSNNLYIIQNKEANDNNNKNNNLGINSQLANMNMNNVSMNNNYYYYINQENNENNNNANMNKTLFFVDQSFPPCQEKNRIIDLTEEISTKEKVSSTEQNKDKKKQIVFHYRPIESLLPDHKQIFNYDEVDPYDIRCGLFKNKNIISVFAHLADYPYLLSKLFVENTVNTIGIYKIKLFYQNFWTDIFVDKFIPCFPCYFPLYTYSPSSLWPCLLEKALAKLYRGYDNLKYVPYFELYQILTGFPIINFKKVYKSIEVNNMVKMFECLQSKNVSDLGNYTPNFKFVVNSNYTNKAVEFVTKDDIINKYLFYKYSNTNPINNMPFSNDNNIENKNNLKNLEEDYAQQSKINFNNENFYNNSYLMGFYASNSYLKYILDIKNLNFQFKKKKIKSIANKIFPIKYANEQKVVIKSIYNYQLKEFFHNYFSEDMSSLNSNYLQNDNSGNNINGKNHNLFRETETLTLPWDMMLTLFDNVIIIKGNNYNELHFRNGFVRCQDVKSPDYDRVLAHTYYELNIKKFKSEREMVRFKEDIKDIEKKIDNNSNNSNNNNAQRGSKKNGNSSENKKKRGHQN